MSSFLPSRRSSFCDETTVPRMRAMIMLAAVTDWKCVVHTAMRTRYHVYANKLTNATSCSGARIGRGFYGCHISAHNRGNESRADFFVADQSNVCGLHHSIGRFNHRDQTFGFNHAECFLHSVAPVMR